MIALMIKLGPFFGNFQSKIHAFMVILVSLFFVFVYPALVPFVNGNKPSNSVQSVFQVGVVCLFCLLFSWIRNSSLSENKQLLFQILCFLVLSILMSVSYNSISRNVFLINAFIFSVLMFEFYPQRKKQLIYIFVFGAIFVLGFLTYYKMLSKSFSISFLFDSLLLYSRYSILNAYFAGPTNVDLGLSMIQSWNIGGFKWLISDFFGNISILNHFSSEQNTVYLFNDFIYHGSRTNDI